MTNHSSGGVFDLSAQIYDVDGNLLNYPILKGGTFKIKVKTFGYTNALKLKFPKSWYINEDYPLYAYWGDVKNYDPNKLEKITKDYMYIETVPDKTGYWEKEFTFILPLNAKSGSSEINIEAMKGDINVLNISNIIIKDKTTLQTKELVRDLGIDIADKSILSQLREYIKSLN